MAAAGAETTAFDGTGLDLLSYRADSNAFHRVVVIDSLVAGASRGTFP